MKRDSQPYVCSHYLHTGSDSINKLFQVTLTHARHCDIARDQRPRVLGPIRLLNCFLRASKHMRPQLKLQPATPINQNDRQLVDRHGFVSFSPAVEEEGMSTIALATFASLRSSVTRWATSSQYRTCGGS